MTAIVMNTLNGAVTEYDWTFQSITPTHAGDNAGFYTLGGDDDAGDSINSEVKTGCTLLKSPHIKTLEGVYFALRGGATGVCIVEARNAGIFNYTFTVRDTGVSRAGVGRGLRENYFGFGFKNVNGADFQLDRIEPVVIVQQQRKV